MDDSTRQIATGDAPFQGVPEDEIEVRAVACKDIIRLAGKVAKRGFEAAGRAYELKGPQDFLTETDIAVENLIRHEISSRFPEDGFLGEESGGETGERYWVVDPIDGTADLEVMRVPQLIRGHHSRA